MKKRLRKKLAKKREMDNIMTNAFDRVMKEVIAKSLSNAIRTRILRITDEFDFSQVSPEEQEYIRSLNTFVADDIAERMLSAQRDESVLSEIIPDGYYKCSLCGEVNEKRWSEEEARAEQRANGWAGLADEDCAVVCDDCYKMIGSGGAPV